MNFVTHLKNPLVYQIIGTLLLMCMGVTSALAAVDLVDVPLTEATPESQNPTRK